MARVYKQVCPSGLYTPSTTVLACVAGEDGACYDDIEDAVTDDGNTPGAIEFTVSVFEIPATVIVELECCPITVPGYTPGGSRRRLRRLRG